MNDTIEFRLRQLERFAEKYGPLVDQLLKDKLIQKAVDKAVADAVQKNNRIYLTWTQRIGAAIVVSLTVAQSLHDIFG